MDRVSDSLLGFCVVSLSQPMWKHTVDKTYDNHQNNYWNKLAHCSGGLFEMRFGVQTDKS